MKNKLSILGFSGSLRRGSYNTGLLRTAKQSIAGRTNFEIVDISEIPLYNEDVRSEGLPVVVSELRERVRGCDGLVMATPEYNHSIPGVLKNTIDWISRPPEQPFNGKALAILGGGGRSGTAGCQGHLRQVASALNLRIMEEPRVLISWIWDKCDQDGSIRDEEVKRLVSDLMECFVRFIEG